MKSLTIDEFCEAEGICRAYFYKLATQGKAPATYKIGRLRRISPELHAAWRSERMAEVA